MLDAGRRRTRLIRLCGSRSRRYPERHFLTDVPRHEGYRGRDRGNAADCGQGDQSSHRDLQGINRAWPHPVSQATRSGSRSSARRICPRRTPATSTARVLVRGSFATPGRFDVFLPPFAIVQVWLERCDVESSAWVFRPPTGEALPRHPVLFRAGDGRRPDSPGDAVSRLRTVSTATDIGRAPEPSQLAVATKTIIDSEYGSPLEIGSIAARCHVPPAVLSREFKDAYGVPPVRYRHQVRIVDALTQLALGVVPADVFQAVGFNDLSRFYKIFRKLACAAPGAYRPVRSRNAKR